MSASTAQFESVAVPARDERARERGWWLSTCLVAVLATAIFTWPLGLHLGEVWKGYLHDAPLARKLSVTQYERSDGFQTAFVQTQVLDNLRHLREPFLDPDEGAAGPAPLHTTSLDTPWIALTGLVWPLFGLAAAYNLMLLLSSALTVVTAMGLFRRHTRWPLVALAGAVVYAFVPYRMLQLTGHFNAVLWWAFPAAAWSFEAMLDRYRDGDRWTVPGAWLVAVTLTVALSGEFHLTLYLSGLVVWLTIWSLTGAALARRRPPWPPLATAAGATVAGCLYALLAFRWAFRGGVAGGNGEYRQVIHYAPQALSVLVRKPPASLGVEGYIYMGWPVVVLAAAGLALALWRRPRARAYAVVTPLLLLLAYGPTTRNLFGRVGLHGFDAYRPIIDTIPLLKLQRVSGRIMVITAMVLVLLAIVAVDALGHWLAERAALLPQLGAVLLVLGTLWVVNDYRVVRSVVVSSQDDNRVVRALARSGDRAGPFLGLPVLGQASPVNSATTFLAAQSRRSTLNAYNQTAAPWLDARNRQLAPLNRGRVTDAALAVLRATGTRHVVVIDEPNQYRPGQSRAVVDRLLASGHFQLAVEDGPLTLLTLTG
jgi:hypothetical protein